jgi:FkbM family methyltransferase
MVGGMVKIVKVALKRMIRSLGYDLTALPGEADYRFAPRPEDRHKWLQSMGIRTILDVGAHTGESALEFRRIFPEAMIYSFEPIRDCFLQLEARTAGMGRQKSFNVALGDAEGKGEIHRSEYSPSSSLLEMGGLHKSAYPFSAAERVEPIQLRTLDGMAPSLDLTGEVLLKIDTQGFELKVLKGGENTLRAVRIVIVEASFGELYRGQPRFPEVYRWLEERGFEYRGSWDQFHNPKDGMPIQQDGIFIRP